MVVSPLVPGGVPHPAVRRVRRGRGPARTMRGGTLLGFMIGLILGLTVAVVVALFITRAPVPFVNRAARAPERIAEPKGPGELPDPNKPLYSKTRPAPAPDATQQPAPEDRRSILERLFGRRADAPPPVAPAAGTPPLKGEPKAPDAKAGAEQRVPPAPITESKPIEPDRSAYLLQAGAFRSQEDADAMRARLALVGFEARVISAEVNGQTMYRVRVGPFAQLEDMNKARSRLAENGIEASVVRHK